MKCEAKPHNQKESGEGSDACGNQEAHPAGTNRDDDEDDLSPFKHGDLKGCRECDTIPTPNTAELSHGGGILRERSLLVMKRNLACRPKDGLTKPAESEEQKQRTDHELKRVKGNPRQCIPEGSNEGEQDRHSRDASAQGSTPASDTSNRQDNRQRLDTFHQTCQKTGNERWARVCPMNIHHPLLTSLLSLMLGRNIVIQNFAIRVTPPTSKQAPTILQIFTGWVSMRNHPK